MRLTEVIILEPEPVTETVTIAVTAGEGGTATGGGVFNVGEQVTLRATPNSGWQFAAWVYVEEDLPASGMSPFTFAAETDRALQAHFFQPQQETHTEPQQETDTIENPHSDWAAPYLERARDLGLIPAALRHPSVDLRRPITRAEFAGVAVLVYENLANVTVQPAVADRFTDTQDADVRRAYHAGIMIGTSPTAFSPDMMLNREQAATALTRSFRRWFIPGSTFATDGDNALQFAWPTPFADDGSISYWARESVYFMAANGIVAGTGDHMFSPRAVTSAQVAQGYAQATREQALVIAVRMAEHW